MAISLTNGPSGLGGRFADLDTDALSRVCAALTEKLKGPEKTAYVLLSVRGTRSADMVKLGVATPSCSRTLRARLTVSNASGTAPAMCARAQIA